MGKALAATVFDPPLFGKSSGGVCQIEASRNILPSDTNRSGTSLPSSAQPSKEALTQYYSAKQGYIL